jgi:hypothetical protein
MCAFGGKTKKKLCCCHFSSLLFASKITPRKYSLRSQLNDGKKGKKRTTAAESSAAGGRTNHVKAAPVVNARSHKSTSKTNTRNSTNLKSNDDNNGASSLSIGSGGSSVVHSSTNNSTHTTTTTTASTTQPSIVKLSAAPSSTGSARTSSPIVNVTIMKKYRDEPSTSRTPDMPLTFGSVPTAGGLKFAFEQQHQPTVAGLVVNTNTQHAMKESPPSSPGSEASARKRRKPTPQASPHEYKEKEKIVQNGAIAPTHHMLGNQLNPSGNMAKNMAETLSMEIEAHSIYSHEPAANLVGPQYPGRKDSVSSMTKIHSKF